MAMLQTTKKEAGEPKGSPAGKAAPADKAPAGKTSPEAIRADARMEGSLAWIAKRPPGFLSRVPGGHRKR